jgi:hypothetical protein
MFLVSFLSKAQTIENFSDGNIHSNPTWLGDDSLFKVNALFQLQSQNVNAQTGDRFLATQQTLLEEMEWQIWLRMGFNASTQNQVKLVLGANQSNLKSAFNGYYVQLGGSTGNTDSISLYVQKDGQKTCLIKGRPATLGKTINTCFIKVLRKKDGTWQLFSDTSNTSDFVLEGTCQDTSITQLPYWGFVFKCTIGNVTNLLIDDIYFGSPILDFTPPQLIASSIQDSQSLQLHFSEKVKAPIYAQIDQQSVLGNSADGLAWTFKSPTVLKSDTPIEVQILQVNDVFGNSLDTQFYLSYHPLQIGELLITELMPDPDPPLGLPNSEFIELYNNSAFPINLAGIKLSDPSTVAALPKYQLPPYTYLVLCAAKDTASYAVFGNVLGLASLPSLNNSSDKLSLHIGNTLLQELDYNLLWYKDKLKENGGYSLEMLHPNQTCKGSNNWQASIDGKGGTPAQINSQFTTSKDTLAPICIGINILDNTSILLQFNEDIEQVQAWLDSLKSHWPMAEKYEQDVVQKNSITLHLNAALTHKEGYTISTAKLSDCLGNTANQVLNFTYYESKAPQQNDVIINEIYYDENRIGAFPNHEFIELYNRSKFAIKLHNMWLSDASTSVQLKNYLLLPDSFVIICNEEYLEEFKPYGNCSGVASLPALSLSDKISLQDSQQFMIHQVNYSDEWIKNNAPVYTCSIELIDPYNPCTQAQNWRGSKHPMGATPGFKNSVAATNPDEQDPQLLRVYAPSKNQLQLSFTEELDSLSLTDSLNFCLNQTLYANYFRVLPNNRKKLELLFPENLDSMVNYALHIKQASDCAGNVKQEILSQDFQLPQEAKPGELVINELLFNPKPGAYDFIELYNTSDHSIQLSNLHLINFGSDRERNMDILFALEGYQIQAHEHLAISENPALANTGKAAYNEALWIPTPIPSMSDEGTQLILVNPQNITLDSVSVDEKNHLSFLYDKEGVSLEKINPFEAGYQGSNWSSASEESGYSSATQQNSQYRTTQTNGQFNCALPYFSPDKDGINDLMTFTYQTEEEKCIGNLFIYNLKGQLIKEVCSSCILANKGEYHWQGDTQTGAKAGIGNYIALWKVYNAAGEIAHQKLSFSLLAN